MNKEDLMVYENRNIKVSLKNSYYYSGIIQKINDDNFLMTDKFGKLVTIPFSEIVNIEEVSGVRK